MGMLPNFRSVTAGANVPKETTREKLVTATEDNYDYTSLFFAGFIAADSFLTKSTPEFHQGAAGFARYYWHTVADQSVENYFVELIVPAITHEDSRYYAMGKEGGSFWKRAGYSLSRGVVTRTEKISQRSITLRSSVRPRRPAYPFSTIRPRNKPSQMGCAIGGSTLRTTRYNSCSTSFGRTSTTLSSRAKAPRRSVTLSLGTQGPFTLRCANNADGTKFRLSTHANPHLWR